MSNNDDDLKKALAFLLEKEMKDFSLEKKKEFLLKKVSPEIVEKAISLYPLMETNINQSLEEFKKDSKSGFFDSFFDFGTISTVLLSTLGINYLIDLNRDKKTDLFYKEIEKKIKEELFKNTQDMKIEINNQLQGFVKKDEVADLIKEQLDVFTKQRGLNLNLSSKTMKENIVAIQGDLNKLDNKVKEVAVKMENNNLIFKQEMLKELNSIISENNNKLLIQIIENQNKLLLNNKLPEESTEKPEKIEKIEKIEKLYSFGELNTSASAIEKNSLQFEDFKSALIALIESISLEKDIKTFLKGLDVRFY
jgi:hypothetical protein